MTTMKWIVSTISSSLGLGTFVSLKCYQWYETEMAAKQKLLSEKAELSSKMSLVNESLLKEKANIAELLRKKGELLSTTPPENLTITSKFYESIGSILTPTNALLLGGGCLFYFCFQNSGYFSMLKDSFASQFPSLIQRSTQINGKDNNGNDLEIRVSDWTENGIISIFFGKDNTLLDLGMLVAIRESYEGLAKEFETTNATLRNDALSLQEALTTSKELVIEKSRVLAELRARITSLQEKLEKLSSWPSLGNGTVSQNTSTQMVKYNAGQNHQLIVQNTADVSSSNPLSTELIQAASSDFAQATSSDFAQATMALISSFP